MFTLKEKLKAGLNRTHSNITDKIKNIFQKHNVDESLFEEVEEVLIGADVGIKTTLSIIEDLKEQNASESEIYKILKQRLSLLLPEEAKDIKYKKVLLTIGVNGSGKTTSISKLANKLKIEGESVIIAAGDTYRAAAIDQIEIWAKRINVPLIKQQEGAEPASVVYDGISAMLSRNANKLIIDTAGRLHTNVNLVEQLKKIKRIILKRVDEKDIETIMVLDANTGNNSLEQAKVFSKELDINSIFLAKLDSSAKGGFIFSIASELGIPVRYIGVGEGLDDIIRFSKQDFIDELFD